MRIKEIAINIVVFLLVLDIVGFCVWSVSGQIPSDNLYFGVITKNIISLII